MTIFPECLFNCNVYFRLDGQLGMDPPDFPKILRPKQVAAGWNKIFFEKFQKSVNEIS